MTKIMIGVGLLALMAFWGMGGGRLLGVMMRFLWPLLLFYLAYRVVKSMMGADVKKSVPPRAQGKGWGPASAGSTAGGGATVIEICPQCGHEAGPSHRCAKT